MEDQTGIRVDGRSAPSTLSLPKSQVREIRGWLLRGAFCDPRAGGCRPPTPDPWGSLRGLAPSCTRRRVPLRDGKLSWKGFFPDKAALGAMQDRFYGRVGALYGLSRGEKRLEGQPARRHKSVAEYKAESRREGRARRGGRDAHQHAWAWKQAEGARVSACADGRAAARLRRRSRSRSAKLVRSVRVDGSMEQAVTTGRRGLRSRSKPTRSPIAELTRRTIGRPDWDKGRWTLCSINPFLDCVWSPKNPRFWGSVFLG